MFKKWAIAILCALLCVTALVGCDGNDSGSGDSNSSSNSSSSGSSAPTVSENLKNQAATTPNCPYGDGYVFGGWYSDSAMTKLVTVNSDFSKIKALYPKWLTIPTAVNDVLVRSETVKITDSGRENQRMDVLNLSDHYDVKGLNFAGYTKLKVTFTFDVREIDDGYQYVFFYSDEKCNANSVVTDVLDIVGVENDDSFLYSHKFEHGSGKKDTSWGTHTFTAELPMNKLKKDLYIRYGASGKYDDDWQNKNVVVSYEALK